MLNQPNNPQQRDDVVIELRGFRRTGEQLTELTDMQIDLILKRQGLQSDRDQLIADFEQRKQAQRASLIQHQEEFTQLAKSKEAIFKNKLATALAAPAEQLNATAQCVFDEFATTLRHLPPDKVNFKDVSKFALNQYESLVNSFIFDLKKDVDAAIDKAVKTIAESRMGISSAKEQQRIKTKVEAELEVEIPLIVEQAKKTFAEKLKLLRTDINQQFNQSLPDVLSYSEPNSRAVMAVNTNLNRFDKEVLELAETIGRGYESSQARAGALDAIRLFKNNLEPNIKDKFNVKETLNKEIHEQDKQLKNAFEAVMRENTQKFLAIIEDETTDDATKQNQLVELYLKLVEKTYDKKQAENEKQWNIRIANERQTAEKELADVKAKLKQQYTDDLHGLKNKTSNKKSPRVLQFFDPLDPSANTGINKTTPLQPGTYQLTPDAQLIVKDDGFIEIAACFPKKMERAVLEVMVMGGFAAAIVRGIMEEWSDYRREKEVEKIVAGVEKTLDLFVAITDGPVTVSCSDRLIEEGLRQKILARDPDKWVIPSPYHKWNSTTTTTAAPAAINPPIATTPNVAPAPPLGTPYVAPAHANPLAGGFHAAQKKGLNFPAGNNPNVPPVVPGAAPGTVVAQVVPLGSVPQRGRGLGH